MLYMSGILQVFSNLFDNSFSNVLLFQIVPLCATVDAYIFHGI